MTTQKSHSSYIFRRIEQINGEVEKLKNQLDVKSPKHFKTELSYRSWQEKHRAKIAELEDELEILRYPEGYNELPIPVVAEELGIKPNEINHLIFSEEISASRAGKYTKQNFIDRDEIARIYDFGVGGLLERGKQEPEEIFTEAVQFVHQGNLEEVERTYKRLSARDSRYSNRVEALETAISLMKGNLQETLEIIQAKFKYDVFEELTVYLAYLGRLMRGIQLFEHGAQALADQILSITEKQTLDLADQSYFLRSKQIGKRMDETQQRSIFLAAAVLKQLKKYKRTKYFKKFNDRNSEMQEEEFEGVIRDAIYTALQAESTYAESATSKIFIDILVSEIPRWYAPAESLEHVSK